MQTIIFTALITAGLCFTGFVTYGQTFSEWWQQKKTRIKYLRQQTAILRVFKETMKYGYDVAEDGVDSIRAITEEELRMHVGFFRNLKFVKPALKNSREFVSSHALAAVLTKQMSETTKSFIQDDKFTDYDLIWLGSYMTVLLMGLREDLEELDLLTSNGVIIMKDNERYEKIRATASRIRATYEAGMSFLLQMDEILVAMQENANEEFVRRQL